MILAYNITKLYNKHIKQTMGIKKMATVTLYHTSYQPITKIEKDSITHRFDDVLFFAYQPYTPNVGTQHLYEVEVDESELVTVYNLSDDPIAFKEIKDEMEFGFDTPITDDQAFDILTSKHDKTWIEMIADVHYDGDIDMAWSLIDFEKRADFSWTLQRIQAQTAKRDGFLGAISEDEQGEVVMIPMFEKEHLLTYKGEW